MASRQLGETFTRRIPASPAQNSHQQDTAREASERTPNTSSSSSFKHQRKLSSIGQPSPRVNTSVAQSPTTNTNLTTSSKSSNTRPRSIDSAPHQALRAPQLPSGESYFTTQTAASGTEARSPANKRPPASRSSHGIETSTGPPPALSTQRTLTIDGAWKFPLSEDLRQRYPLSTSKRSAGPEPLRITQRAATNNPATEIEPGSLSKGSTSESTSTDSKAFRGLDKAAKGTGATSRVSDSRGRGKVSKRSSADDLDLLKTSTRSTSARSNGVMRRNTITEGSTTTEELRSQSSQEDFFLNLAQDEDPQESNGLNGQLHTRRSRTALGTHRPSLSQSTIQTPERRPQSSGGYEASSYTPVLTERVSSIHKADRPSYLRTPTSNGRPTYNHRSYAASAHPLDSNRHYSAPSEASPDLPSYGRRPSIPESTLGFSARPYRQSHLSHANSGHYHSSPLTGRAQLYEQDSPPTPRAEGTESTVSTTAPSTIFDELDDLKSRLKKLELTARMPASSGAAISGITTDRPTTATTTITTMSTSPKRTREMSISPGESTVNGPVDPSTHPLLRAALEKSKPGVSPQVYRALDTAVSDALTLAQMTTPNAATNGNIGGIDRRVKRKADSMCRSLTELCLALSEDKTLTSGIDGRRSRMRSPSRDATIRLQREGSIEQQRPQRAMSHDPEETSTSRVLSRLEARRTSMLGMNGSAHSMSTKRDSQVEQPTTPAQTTSGINRSSTVLQRGRRVIDDDNERTIRPTSRATIELSLARPPLRQSPSSKDYTASPTQDQQRVTIVQSNLPVRRNYLLSTSHLSTTPNIQLGHQRYLERPAPGSADNARLMEARQRRLASMGQYNMAVRQSQGAEGLGRRLRRPSVDQFGVDTQGVD